MRWLPTWQIQPGLYAMCAAAAMLGGVFRASISLVVIFVESSKVEHTPFGTFYTPEHAQPLNFYMSYCVGMP